MTRSARPQTQRTSIALALGVAAIAFLLAACSDSDDRSTDAALDGMRVTLDSGPAPDARRDDDTGPSAPATCDGWIEPPRGSVLCRSNDECASIGACVVPGDTNGCGPPPPMECVTDADCAGGAGPRRVCVGGGDCGGEICTLACDEMGVTCPEGTRCEPAGGHCDPIACDDGWTCPASAQCVVGAPDGDEHGCVRRRCLRDDECDCGACVSGLCHDGPGTCMPPAP